MKEKIISVLDILGKMRVDGWENFEKLVYVKLMLEELVKSEVAENGE